jgi:hypothetical protein
LDSAQQVGFLIKFLRGHCQKHEKCVILLGFAGYET